MSDEIGPVVIQNFTINWQKLFARIEGVAIAWPNRS